MHDLLLLDASIPLRDEGLQLRQLSVAINETLGDDGLNAPNRLECVFTHVLVSDLNEDLIRQLLLFVSGNMDKVAR